jgi:hypothetical protein|tara:strand:- start:315 stop:443 length:129 start_codon:yes stop_codon:yes gene_type:complete
MAMQPYEKEQEEILIQGIPVKNILIGGGVLIAVTLIIWLVKR